MAFRNDDPDADATANGTGRPGYTDGTPGVTAPTPARDVDLNMFQEEIVRTVERMGLTLDKTNNEQLSQALKLAQAQGVGSAVANTTDKSADASSIVDYYAGTYNGANAPRVAVLVGGDSGSPKIESKSWDGSGSWTTRTPAAGSTLTDVVWADSLSLFVAVGESGTIMTSPDGTTWTVRTSTFGSSHIYSVAWSEDDTLLVAVGASGKIETSPDGITWTARTSAGSVTFFNVTRSESQNLWCAVGASGTIETSPDGITWSARTAAGAYAATFSAVTYTPALDLFVASGAGPEIQTSPDGTTWTSQTLPSLDGTEMSVVAFAGVLVAFTNHTNLVSYDGETWLVAGHVPTASYDFEGIKLSDLGNSLAYMGDGGLEVSNYVPNI